MEFQSLLSIEAIAELPGDGLSGLVVRIPGLPFNDQSLSALDGSPCICSDNGNLACVLVGSNRIGGDLEDIEDAGGGFGFRSVEAEEIAAKIRALGTTA